LGQPLDPPAGSPPSRLLAGERIVQIADMAELAGQWADYRRAQAAAEHGFRTALFVPLRRDADLLGFIVAIRTEVRLYSEKEIALLENFAAQAVIAIENARLLTEIRDALERQTATAEVLQVINSADGNLGPVFEAMLDKALDLCGAAFGTLWIYSGEAFNAVAPRRVPISYAEAVSGRPVTPLPRTILGNIATGSVLAQVLDATADEAYSDTAARVVVELGHMRTMAGVALRKDGALLGAITVYRQEVRPFSDKQMTLLQNFATQAVIAMENARLLGELRQRTEEVAELNRGLEARVAAQVEELGRVGLPGAAVG
jgi:GAF domain-containing protein